MYSYQQQQYQYHYRRSSSTSSTSSWSAEDNAQMMPAYNHPNYTPAPYANRRKSSASASSERSCGGLTAEDTRDLWKCMLQLQSEYGCYTSARIDAAMEAGDEGVNLMPTRFIIDTLNESALQRLPVEGLVKLNRYLRAG